MANQALFKSLSRIRYQDERRVTNQEGQGTERVPDVVFSIVNYLLKRFATDENIVTVDADIRAFKQKGLSATDYTQQV